MNLFRRDTVAANPNQPLDDSNLATFLDAELNDAGIGGTIKISEATKRVDESYAKPKPKQDIFVSVRNTIKNLTQLSSSPTPQAYLDQQKDHLASLKSDVEKVEADLKASVEGREAKIDEAKQFLADYVIKMEGHIKAEKEAAATLIKERKGLIKHIEDSIKAYAKLTKPPVARKTKTKEPAVEEAVDVSEANDNVTATT